MLYINRYTRTPSPGLLFLYTYFNSQLTVTNTGRPFYLDATNKVQVRLEHDDVPRLQLRQNLIVTIVRVRAYDDSLLWRHEAIIVIQVIAKPDKGDILRQVTVVLRCEAFAVRFREIKAFLGSSALTMLPIDLRQ